ncbi:MAG: SpoIIIAH-like family protein [Syntrophomonadaceae bacterium]|jgi:stage III sporulation protein AH
MVFTLPKIKKKLLGVSLLFIVIVAGSIFVGGNSDKNLEGPVNNNTQVNDVNQVVNNLEQSIVNNKDGEFFAEYRLQRERNRSREIHMLQELSSNEEQAQPAREAASMRIMRIMEDIDKEMKAENLVKSRGIAECVIISEPAMSTVIIKGSAAIISEDEIKEIISPVLGISQEEISMVFRDE